MNEKYLEQLTRIANALERLAYGVSLPLADDVAATVQTAIADGILTAPTAQTAPSDSISDEQLKEELMAFVKRDPALHKGVAKELLQKYGGNKVSDIAQDKRRPLIAELGLL
jgi:tellurite resistance protein